MATRARVLADSISPDGVRLVTFECVYPRIVHAEVMTHRVFSRNAASSRAIPVERLIKQVIDDPYVPTHWGKNQKGMQAYEEVDGETQFAAHGEWLRARDYAVDQAQRLLNLGIHKQITNRLLEPFQWYTCIITATEWSNWDHLRDNEQAHPEIQMMARLMKEARGRSTPRLVQYYDTHLPLIHPEDSVADYSEKITAAVLKKVSVGRCARVSYLTHAGIRDLAKDIELHDSLLKNGHMSPFEHVARPMRPMELAMFASTVKEGTPFCGNFRGWVQYRKEIHNEEDILRGRT